MQTRGDAIAWALVAVAIAMAVILLVHRTALSPDGRVIVQDAHAPWIMLDTPVSARIQQWGREEIPTARFGTGFRLAGANRAHARLRVRMFGDPKVSLNGKPIRLPDEVGTWRSWRMVEIEPGLVREGANSIEVEVRNLQGPPLLALALEVATNAGEVGEQDALLLATSPEWGVRIDDGTLQRTRIAEDVRLHPESLTSDSVWDSLVVRWAWLGVALLSTGAGYAYLRQRRDIDWERLLAPAAVTIVVLAWGALFVVKFVAIPLDVGFDAGNHLLYLEIVESQRRVPLATEGWSTYHPPLFYVLSAGISAAGGAVGIARELALKLLPFWSGLGCALLAFLLARRLLPDAVGPRVHALLFAGFLPVNLYMAAYFSNEGLHAVLAAAVLVLAVDLLLDEEPRLEKVTLLSIAMGLAMLAKFTAVVVTGLSGVAVAVYLAWRYRSRPARLAAHGAALLVPALVICGWFYARNMLEYGRPLVGNWDLPGVGLAWWSPPGFHTSEYYLSFGESLARPYFSGFASFWDAIYSTLWGDGFLGGRGGFKSRHPHWNYITMAAGYGLALPATALLAGGVMRCIGLSVHDPDPRRRAALGLVVVLFGAMSFAIFYTTLALPYLGQARASYLLALTPALALFFALGADAVEGWLADRGWAWARVGLVAWLGALYGFFYFGFAA